ncbi:MAG: DNA alkylation repair protein [Propionicimonas sp.]|nr:DNA alkylation repair protein [Propionicimonas sp.]
MIEVPALVAAIDAALRERAVPERAAGEKAYLKSDLDHYGTALPVIRRIVRTETRPAKLTHDEVVALAGALWAAPVHERRVAASELLVAKVDLLQASDITLLERLLRESRTWALVDSLAASAVGPLVAREPGLGSALDRWAADDDFWLRRAALLALLVPLRRGGGDFERFGRYADTMLEEKEFFVRKAIGWVLRDTGKLRPELVFDWLLPRAARASGVTVREAVKYLKEDQRAAVLAVRR